MTEYQSGCVMRAWRDEDRPREKFERKGNHALTEAELLAILIGSGTPEESALDLAGRLLDRVNGNLVELSRLSMNDLMETRGIGKAKAILILSALELGRRRRRAARKDKQLIRSSSDAYEVIATHLEDKPHEEFWVIFLNRANRVIHIECISRGGISGTVVDNRIIFKIALQRLASGIILAHNHPSGNLRPSQSDITLTKKLVQAGQWLEVSVMDHLIITESGYYSFADQGQI